MFSSLAKYKEQIHYDKHPVLYYLTPSRNYKLELYAGIVVKWDALIYVPNPDAYVQSLISVPVFKLVSFILFSQLPSLSSF